MTDERIVAAILRIATAVEDMAEAMDANVIHTQAIHDLFKECMSKDGSRRILRVYQIQD
jgi:hypothetical protein